MRVVWIEIGKFGRNTIPGHVTTLCGLCGLKYFSVNYFYTFTKVTTLCGLCGLKFLFGCSRQIITCHNPLRVVWIEIICIIYHPIPSFCHNPLRVVWIEICDTGHSLRTTTGHNPLRVVWIEISKSPG